MNKKIEEKRNLKENSFQFYIKREGWPLSDLVAYCTGEKLICPKCNNEKIVIFFKQGFLGKYQNEWCDVMDANDFELCDDYQIIIKHNFNPNWICKNCYNGGVILKK